MSALVGKTLKDYYVLRRLGQGAMAEVYLAQQISLGRQVALKVLNAELARDPIYVERFHHEARAAAALGPRGNRADLRSGAERRRAEGTAHFIAQEYVPGRNLGEVIRSRGRLEPALALDILRQVAAALAKAASEGIVHRDIKPENIMLARSGEVKVADFGLARVQGDGGVNLTQIGVTMGTPLYMSPEQIEGRPLDSRSDIYSLGVTAYHMLAGDTAAHRRHAAGGGDAASQPGAGAARDDSGRMCRANWPESSIACSRRSRPIGLPIRRDVARAARAGQARCCARVGRRRRKIGRWPR